MRISILGVPIDAVTREQAREWVSQAVQTAERPYFVVTPNPEMVVMAQKRPKFKEALCRADLAIPDGFGLLLAAKWQGKYLPERVTGSDLVLDVCQWAARSGKTVFFLGGEPGMAEKSAEIMNKMFPGIRIVGAERGGRFYEDQQGIWHIDDTAWNRLQRAKPDVLLAGLRFGGQETWLWQNLAQMPWLKLAMGIGGSFEFIGGKIRRAPKLMRQVGLEWLWRLMMQPNRWRRIIRAVIVFPSLIFKAKR